MRDTFPGYYRPTDEEFDRLWKEGWFVLDANILLNLYRYREKARDEFMKVLEALAPRIWVPHQAVLEYQRNRVKTIREQLQKFRDVRKLVNFTTLQNNLSQYNNRLRSSIDPAQFLESVKAPYELFGAHITEVEDRQIKVESDESNDPVRGFLDTLLPDRVGPVFTQGELDDLHEAGAARYKRETPPGYLDPSKKGISEYDFAGCTYKREFGDWILWKQVLNWAREKKIENVVFVTDDRTGDWWEITKDDGGPAKTVGPRPELAAEIRAEAGVKLFYMYPADAFLGRAVAELNLEVATSSIREVREVAESESARDATIFFKSSSWGLLDMVSLGASVNGIDTLVLVADDVFVDWFGVKSNAPAVLLAALEENRDVVEEVARQAIREGRINAGGMGWLTSPDFRLVMNDIRLGS